MFMYTYKKHISNFLYCILLEWFNIFQEDYILDSFIEYIPPRSKRSVDHYISFKKVNQVWLTYDNTVCWKASMMGSFRVNLAFYRSTSKSLPGLTRWTSQKLKVCVVERNPMCLNLQNPYNLRSLAWKPWKIFFNQESELDSASLQPQSGFFNRRLRPKSVNVSIAKAYKIINAWFRANKAV